MVTTRAADGGIGADVNATEQAPLTRLHSELLKLPPSFFVHVTVPVAVLEGFTVSETVATQAADEPRRTVFGVQTTATAVVSRLCIRLTVFP